MNGFISETLILIELRKYKTVHRLILANVVNIISLHS
jgi:hypothetical protein